MSLGWPSILTLRASFGFRVLFLKMPRQSARLITASKRLLRSSCWRFDNVNQLCYFPHPVTFGEPKAGFRYALSYNRFSILPLIADGESETGSGWSNMRKRNLPALFMADLCATFPHLSSSLCAAEHSPPVIISCHTLMQSIFVILVTGIITVA